MDPEDKTPVKDTKTRTMAHSRRQKENDTFTEIAQTLPIQEHTKDLDKASILRVAINFLKLRDVIRESSEEEELVESDGDEGVTCEGVLGEGSAECEGGLIVPAVPQEPSITDILPNFSKDVLQALDGFMLVFSSDGRVLFTSETIAQYLGLRQVDVIGVNVTDILHPQDCTELASIFQTQGHDSEQVFDQKDPLRRKFLVRMRCAFTPSVRSITRCSNFKPVYCSCYLKFAQSGPRKGQFIGLVAMCKLASPTKIKEMVVGTFFKTKHSLDLSYTSLDRRIYWILGYDPSEMVGLKAYQYFHPEDLTATSSCHMNLLSRGRSHSPCYRILSRWGDWMWVRSKSHMVYNTRNQLPEGIVIYTWIVRVEEEDERMLAIQDGDDGESKLKQYDPFEDKVSSSDGELDISNLVPTATNQETTPTTSPVSQTSQVEPLVIPVSTNLAQPVKQDLSPPYGTATPPDSAFYEETSNLNPFTMPSPPSSLSEGNSCRGSPERQTTHGAAVGDQSQSSDSLYMPSYKLSPPYTPYAEQGEMNGYSSNPSPLLPMSNAPHRYKLEHAFSDSSMDSVPFTPTSCRLQQTHLPSHPAVYPQYTTTSCDVASNKMAAYPPDSFGMELRNPTNLTGFMYTSERPISFQTSVTPPSSQSACGQKQTFINDARIRYSGTMPSVAGGHMTGSHHGNQREESERISQWSQWLKGTAPPPVC